MTVARTLARVAATATAMAGLCLAPQSTAVAAYLPGEYRLTIYSVQINDISGRIDAHQSCAEIYGTITVTHQKSHTFFRAEREDAVEVCEPNRPLKEGIQSGHLRPNRTTEIISEFSGDKAEDTSFRFEVDLWDRDQIGSDQQLMHKSVSVWPPEPATAPTQVSDVPLDSTVYFRYNIENLTQRNADDQGESFRREEFNNRAYQNCRSGGGSEEECRKWFDS